MTIPYVFIIISSFMFVSSIHGLTFNSSSIHGSTSQLKHYIVYMGEHSLPDPETVIKSNHEMLSSYVGSLDEARSKIVHHYHKSFRGFSAMLMPEQANELRKNKFVASVFESQTYQLHTTRSWDFMTESTRGKAKGQFKQARSRPKGDVIVGHFDSGIWPESASFDPHGFHSVPEYFRGECIPGESFTKANCNGKIVGARYYSEGYERNMGPLELSGRPFYRSARDDFGHGTHTASTAVGNEVRNVNILDMSGLTVVGGAPHARIAVYKTCWFNQCDGADVLKAFDDAIHDNIDVITMSLGPMSIHSYFDDPFSIGAFHAFKNGIVVVASAGNNGRSGSYTVTNPAPWILTVAASSVDREFFSGIQFEDGFSLKGYGINAQALQGYYPLIWGASAAVRGIPMDQARQCQKNTLNSEYIRGKIVVCVVEGSNDDRVDKAQVVREGGGVGMILIAGTQDKNEVFDFAVPTCVIGDRESPFLEANWALTATFLPTKTVLRNNRAPRVAVFSSKGPNPVTQDLNKPDITAPGVDILAAIPGAIPGSGTRFKPNDRTYGIDSGTSMAAPHVAGVAAVIKAMHRDWSPAAIQSALMTTASSWDNTGQLIQAGENIATPFDFGSGHLDPDRALSPGLVYDFGVDQLIDFLCPLARDANSVNLMQSMVGRQVTCKYPLLEPFRLNYPSISISNLNGPVQVTRTLTLVDEDGPLIYKSHIEVPIGVSVYVDPQILDFSKGKRKIDYTLYFQPLAPLGIVTGNIVWTDSIHTVKTPFVLNLG